MILECYKLFKKIEARPAMWTGENTLKSINIYANGYYEALLDNEIYYQSHTDEPFFDWVAKKLGYYESTAGWANMILGAAIGFDPENINWEEVFSHVVTKEEHSKSIVMFYELLDEYKSEHE